MESELWFSFDGHGSTRVLLDVAGAIAQVFAYDAYGQAIGFDPAAALTEFLYSGEQFDAKIGQQYLRARYYDPSTGTFNRLDPFFGNLTDPQSLHNYLYCHADPVTMTDPSGLMGAGGGVMALFTMLLSTLTTTEDNLAWLKNAKVEAYLKHHDGVEGRKVDKLTKPRKEKLVNALYASKLVYKLQSGHGLTIVKDQQGKDVIWNLGNGLKAALYLDKDDKYILAFSGTDMTSIHDWDTNIRQAFGTENSKFLGMFGLGATQYSSVEEVVNKARLISGNNISTITGHSLGGGLATLASIIYGNGKPLIIFNPAQLHRNTIGNLLQTEESTFFRQSEVWTVDGDPLTKIQDLPNKFPDWLMKIDYGSVVETSGLGPLTKIQIGKFHSLDIIEKFLLESKTI